MHLTEVWFKIVVPSAPVAKQWNIHMSRSPDRTAAEPRTHRANLISGTIDLVPPLKSHAVEVALDCFLLVSPSAAGLSSPPVEQYKCSQR